VPGGDQGGQQGPLRHTGRSHTGAGQDFIFIDIDAHVFIFIIIIIDVS